MQSPVVIAHENRPSPPWISSGSDGSDQVLVREAALQVGIQIRLQPMPWDHCFAAAQEGEVDGVLSASFRLRRLEAVVYPTRIDGRPDTSRCLHTDSYAIYRRVGSVPAPNERVAAPRGFAAVEILSDLGIAVDDRTDDIATILTDLATGRSAAAALLSEVADRMIQASPSWRSCIVRDPMVLPAKPYYLVFARPFHARHPDSCTALWEAVAKVRDSAAWRNRVP